MTSKNVLKLNDLRSETDLINKKSGYDLIFLNDFTLQANVGVYKHEKEKTQPIKINVIAKVRNPKRINLPISVSDPVGLGVGCGRCIRGILKAFERVRRIFAPTFQRRHPLRGRLGMIRKKGLCLPSR